MDLNIILLVVLCTSPFNVLSQNYPELTDFQGDILCNKLGLHKIYYDRGVFQCSNGRITPACCLIGDQAICDTWFCGSPFMAYENVETYQKAVKKFCSWNRADPGKLYAVYRDFRLHYCGNDASSSQGLISGECLFTENFKDELDVEFDYTYFHRKIPTGKDLCVDYGLFFLSFIKPSEIQFLTSNCPNGAVKHRCIEPWAGRTVYYSLEACNAFRLLVEEIMREFSRKTCIRFKKITGHYDKIRYPNHVNILETPRGKHRRHYINEQCSTDIGMRGGAQIMEAHFYCVFQKFHQLIGLPDDMPFFSVAQYANRNLRKLRWPTIRRIKALYKC